VITAIPSKASNTAAAARIVKRRRSQTHPMSGAKTTVVPTTNADISTDVVCIPTVQSTKPMPSSAPRTRRGRPFDGLTRAEPEVVA